jgi:hypothetical protein
MTLLLNNCLLYRLNVKKYAINSNINLTCVTGSLHIFAPYQFIHYNINLNKKV